MKNPSKFALELAITVIVAYLLSLIVSFVLVFVFGNMGPDVDTKDINNLISGAVFGLIVGFKLNSLLRQHK